MVKFPWFPEEIVDLKTQLVLLFNVIELSLGRSLNLDNNGFKAYQVSSSEASHRQGDNTHFVTMEGQLQTVL